MAMGRTHLGHVAMAVVTFRGNRDHGHSTLAGHDPRRLRMESWPPCGSLCPVSQWDGQSAVDGSYNWHRVPVTIAEASWAPRVVRWLDPEIAELRERTRDTPEALLRVFPGTGRWPIDRWSSPHAGL
jgi:hypothetical protein